MDIDYANVFAQTVYGKIGIKVWICKGEVLAKRDLNPNFVGGKEARTAMVKEEMIAEVVTLAVMTETQAAVAVDRRGGGGGGNRGRRRWRWKKIEL